MLVSLPRKNLVSLKREVGLYRRILHITFPCTPIKSPTFENLLSYSLFFAKQLLQDYQEFYPFAAYLDSEGQLIPIAVFEGNDHPDSETLIGQLLARLSDIKVKNNLTAYAICYDVRVTNDNYPDGTDSLLIKVFHSSDQLTTNFYYPYKISAHEISIDQGWREPG
jgi:hypothetical protein